MLNLVPARRFSLCNRSGEVFDCRYRLPAWRLLITRAIAQPDDAKGQRAGAELLELVARTPPFNRPKSPRTCQRLATEEDGVVLPFACLAACHSILRYRAILSTTCTQAL